MKHSDINFEIRRKIFHISSIVFPILYIFNSKVSMIIILLTITILTLSIDTYRHCNTKVKEFIDFFFKIFLRPNEKDNKKSLTGASYMALGLTFSCIFFSKILVINSWLILIISDSLSAIIGMKFGKKLKNGKSYFGLISFFLSAVLISIFVYFFFGYKTNFFVIILSSFFTSLAEFFSKSIKINDNFSIPLVYCTFTYFLSI